MSSRIKLVVSDLAGTVVDFGSCAPAGAFVELFLRAGITVTEDQCRKPMGMNKRDHIVEITRMPDVADQCLLTFGKMPDNAVIDDLYAAFVPLQLEVLPNYTLAIEDAAVTLETLRSMGMAIAFTTGYNREMTSLVLHALKRQGVIPDCSYCADDVPMGRPKPWMIFRSMERLGIFPPSAVINIGDTTADIRSGVNAGTVSVGVYATGNMLGMGKERFDKLTDNEKTINFENGRIKMLEAGADYVIPSIRELPELVRSL